MYFSGRGIDPEVCQRFNLGYDRSYRTLPENLSWQGAMPSLQNLETWQAAIVPLSSDSFVAYKIASIESSGQLNYAPWFVEERRYVGRKQCFNIGAIDRAQDLRCPLFICASEFDALSLENFNLPAVALGQVQNASQLLVALQQQVQLGKVLPPSMVCIPTSASVLTQTGKQEPWDEIRDFLIKSLTALGIACKEVDLSSPYGSLNAAMTQSRAQFVANLYQLAKEQQRYSIDNEMDSAGTHAGLGGNYSNYSDYNDYGAYTSASTAAAAAAAANAAAATSMIGNNSSDATATPGLILSLENLARLQLAPMMYTISSPAVAMTRLVLACLIENQHTTILYAGNKMQWQMICALLNFNPQAGASAGAQAAISGRYQSHTGYWAQFLELPVEQEAQILEQSLAQGLMQSQLNGMGQVILMVDAFAFDLGLCAQLSARLAQLSVEYGVAVVVWCAQEQKSLFEGNSLQTIEMSKGRENEIVFKTLDSSCRAHTFSTNQG